MVSISLLIVFPRSFSATINLSWPIKKQVEQLTKDNSFICSCNAYLVAYIQTYLKGEFSTFLNHRQSWRILIFFKIRFNHHNVQTASGTSEKMLTIYVETISGVIGPSSKSTNLGSSIQSQNCSGGGNDAPWYSVLTYYI